MQLRGEKSAPIDSGRSPSCYLDSCGLFYGYRTDHTQSFVRDAYQLIGSRRVEGEAEIHALADCHLHIDTERVNRESVKCPLWNESKVHCLTDGELKVPWFERERTASSGVHQVHSYISARRY